MQTLIVVPARYASTRFPGKPLAKIGGISMLRRTARTAELASQKIRNSDYVVATDDARIKAHCHEYDIPVVMTQAKVKTGSDRALAAAQALNVKLDNGYDCIVNLQGDAPFTPLEHIVAMAKAMENGAQVATPYIQLSWEALEALRAHKQETPFSGTCVIKAQDNTAIWFSKNIVPAMRKEEVLKDKSELSPVLRHVGLYAYTHKALKAFTESPEGYYESLEGLEQLRLIENGVPITCVKVDPPLIATSGIDTEADLKLAEALIAEHGDPYL
ncbi:3-deoxy-manno-octulosonate cytidylyltransferase [Hellea balneolensis]|uniref:3-deoxy-manno-octulosonate cytidylyltransferase n=1 Tax=Hellea balneolensis TaxID=287478 RepID=UPI000403723E|nr:manno-octulosonate cytidylyltransferase [Hellea balneolensis]